MSSVRKSELKNALLKLIDNAHTLAISEDSNFREILSAYSVCYDELSKDEQEKLSLHFWEIIKSTKMPLIEVNNDGSAQVYFLYRKQKENGKDLYIQGDFHGYGSTLSSQLLNRVGNTDVMCCITPMKKELENALITYHFVEVPPKHRDQRADYFYKEHPEFKEVVDTNWLPDPHSKHSKAFDKRENQFCVNAGNDMTRWCTPEFHEWPTLTEIQNDPRLTHWVQNPGGQIVRGITPLFTDNENLRSIQVFKPTEQVEHIVIVNDGFAYLFCDSLNHLQNFAEKQKCALIFISQLGGLGDSKVHPLGLRGLEYHMNVDKYSAFILEKLLPELNKQGVLPDPHPTNMTVIGASLSGTAALRMGLTHPDKFRQVIAHSPSPFNKEIIDKIPDVHVIASKMRIDIECGQFENPDNAQNDNLSYSHELERLLKVDMNVGLHGHQYEAWVADLDRSLLAIQNLAQKNTEESKVDASRLSSTSFIATSGIKVTSLSSASPVDPLINQSYISVTPSKDKEENTNNIVTDKQKTFTKK